MDEEPPRFNFFSLTFFIGFSAGIFLGVALALVAFAISRDAERDDNASALAGRPSPVPTATSSVTPTPEPLPRTASSLNVHLGPGEAFAAIGTIGSGEEVDIIGRDADGEWVAIRFPPGSTARGWVPADGLTGLQALATLEVVYPTPLASGPPDLPLRSTSTPPLDTVGSGGSEGSLLPTPTSTPADDSNDAGASDSNASGPPDLAITSISLLSDGSVQITLGNRGPGDLEDYAVFVVLTAGAQSETLRAPDNELEVGDTFTVATSTIRIQGETDVVASVDPGQAVPDADRSNNTLRATLTPTSPAED